MATGIVNVKDKFWPGTQMTPFSGVMQPPSSLQTFLNTTKFL